MEKSKINSLQIIAILIMMVCAPLTGMNLTYIFKHSGTDAYLCPLIAAIIGIPLLFIFKYIFDFKPELTLGEKIISVFGKFFGTIINILLIIFTLFFSITLYFNLSDLIVSQFLPETPLKLIAIVFGIAIIYINIKGIETMSRVTLILFILTIILFVTSIFGLFPTFEVAKLKPFLEFGINNPIKGSLHILSVNFFPMFLLLTIPKKQIVDGNKFMKWLILGYIFSSIFMFLIIISIIGNMGINLAKFYQYPEYIVLKRINLFGFLDRIENILSLRKILKMFVFLSFFTFFITNTVKPHSKSKLIPIISVFIMFICSQMLFKSNTLFNNFVVSYISVLRLIFLGIIIFILIGVIIKKLFGSKK